MGKRKVVEEPFAPEWTEMSPQEARDHVWAAAAKRNPRDKAKAPDELLTAGQRRMQQVADTEIMHVQGARDQAVQTLGLQSARMITKATELNAKPTGRMSNKAAAQMLLDLLNPSTDA